MPGGIVSEVMSFIIPKNIWSTMLGRRQWVGAFGEPIYLAHGEGCLCRSIPNIVHFHVFMDFVDNVELTLEVVLG